ncbi:homeobox protein PKNOX1-like isoform X1 [Rhopilema esculentum]|uniref:homeobox protein PKNOX1-like isoform X1 n=2 Tax=Rhopilema esculentum TaxID=499914 RepID=UPI0031DDF96E
MEVEMEGPLTSRPFGQISSTHNQQPVSQQQYVAGGDVASLQRQVDRITQEGQFLGIQATDVQQIGLLENQKLLVYRHPLFPLLGKIFEECELATNSLDAVNSQAFDQEIKTFITLQAKEGKPFFTDDADTDQLMLKALQVLRIHLLEMEKVNELCKDFCSRYIACLKGKLNSENLMRTLNVHSVSPTPDEFSENQTSVPVSQVQHPQPVFPPQQALHGQFNGNRPVNLATTQPQSPQQTHLTMALNTVTPNASLVSDVSDGSLPSTPSSPSEEMPSLGGSDKKKNSSKRGIFPKHATNIMKAWLFQHLVHPYPTEDEKRQIAAQTNLTILQVNNWFINARRRILQPMLDSSTSYASLSRAKKIKPQKVPAQRAWPESIGVYTPYHSADGIQYHTTGGALPAGYTVVSPGIAPQGQLIVNVGTPANTHQSLAIGSQVQFVQVSTVPTVVQALPAGLIQVTPSGQVTTTSAITAIAVPDVQGSSDLRGSNAASSPKTVTTAYSIGETPNGDTNVLKGDGSETEVR